MPTVLVADDEPAVLTLTAMLLEGAGYAVLRAVNGVEALMLYASYADRVDVVLTDVEMPEMNGIELAARIRDRNPDARILFMSGFLPPGARIPSGYRMISKPFKSTGLLRALADELKR
jgi:two-component system cell cycle sensor histidine kinase/response regulator CckA